MVPFLYWFVEVFVQLMLIWTALFMVPAVRRWARRDPFADHQRRRRSRR